MILPIDPACFVSMLGQHDVMLDPASHHELDTEAVNGFLGLSGLMSACRTRYIKSCDGVLCASTGV